MEQRKRILNHFIRKFTTKYIYSIDNYLNVKSNIETMYFKKERVRTFANKEDV